METRILIGTALSGGSLRELLEEAVDKYGTAQLALGVERTAMDFPLPCRGGYGTPLKPEALAALRRSCGAPVFFSEALCAKYFTYRRDSETRLVLFDDDETVGRKLALAQSLGIGEAFRIYTGP